EEDPEEEPEEEEIEDEDMVNDEEDDAEVINPYEEDDPHNRPPPTSDKETEFAPPVVQIADADDVPIPTVIRFGIRENRLKNSKMLKMIIGLSREFTKEEPSIYSAPVERADDPYVMVRDAAMDIQGDQDVDTDAP
nr:hypothetical protein [Tanacetum cinerariifolium]